MSGEWWAGGGSQQASPTSDGNNMTIMTLLTATTWHTGRGEHHKCRWGKNSIQFVQLWQNLKSVSATSTHRHTSTSRTLVDIYRSTYQYVMCKRISNRFFYFSVCAGDREEFRNCCILFCIICIIRQNAANRSVLSPLTFHFISVSALSHCANLKLEIALRA